jgi:hypothetical protein
MTTTILGTPNINTKPGTRVIDWNFGSPATLGTFQGWDEDGDALVIWDGYDDEDSVNAGWVRIVTITP